MTTLRYKRHRHSKTVALSGSIFNIELLCTRLSRTLKMYNSKCHSCAHTGHIPRLLYWHLYSHSLFSYLKCPLFRVRARILQSRPDRSRLTPPKISSEVITPEIQRKRRTKTSRDSTSDIKINIDSLLERAVDPPEVKVRLLDMVTSCRRQALRSLTH